MQIKCSECERPINIPDEKLPKGKAFNITCPGCKAKVRVDQHLKSPAPAPKAEAKKEEVIDTPAIAITQNFEDDDDDLVIYDENDKLALILDEKNKEVWTKVLEEKEYKLQYAKSPEHAAHKMKFTQFHFVALADTFGDGPLLENPLYQNLLELPMELRRDIFVALVGANYKTLSNMEAFAFSVNLVVNEKDFAKLPDILKKSVTDHEFFYKVFKETLHAAGKS